MLVIWLGAGAPGALGITSALFQLVIALPMALAPSNRKHPSTTVMPRRNSDLPDSISSPIAATATTATLVATLPSAAPSTHATPSAMGLCTGESVSDAVGEYIKSPVAIIQDRKSTRLNSSH